MTKHTKKPKHKKHVDHRLNQAFIRAHRIDAATGQGNRCAYCRTRFNNTRATADHEHAKANGGRDGRNNIAAACRDCNRIKGKLSVDLFRRMIESPRSGEPIRFLIIWSVRRVNLRIELMERRLMRYVGGEVTS